ncbi:hypothetical protein AX15_005271 [Amanita polypyramis BW_CC]|nr:hypothetical protein AX15_005271 [Amanita polypyramis BW_CC]
MFLTTRCPTIRIALRANKLAQTQRLLSLTTRELRPRLASKSISARPNVLQSRVGRTHASQAIPVLIRGFSSSQKCQNENSGGKKEIPPEWWIGALETTANAPWLFHLPQEPVDRLKRTFTLIFQIILYLGRPQETEMAHQFLNVSGKSFSTKYFVASSNHAHLQAFGTAIVPPESEIGRARRAVATITRAVVQDISSIPESSPLREQHAELFGVFGALEPLHDVYLKNTENNQMDVREWGDFWSKAEPVLISIAQALDEKGFGLEADEREAANGEK